MKTVGKVTHLLPLNLKWCLLETDTVLSKEPLLVRLLLHLMGQKLASKEKKKHLRKYKYIILKIKVIMACRIYFQYYF